MLILLAPPGLEDMFEEDGEFLENTHPFRETKISGGRALSCPVISERFVIVNIAKALPESEV
ncbi:hypothetical protein KQ944_14170 [Bacillus subtilis]|uniref:hypothetical protein n=1 Tax=Pseudochrobactrum asaccharolyticum TaxID=354351 RepID=UPI001F18F108|nr:hypothetical protein [Pseudochrobactrum asaccharolyticum]MCF7646641.1 hypothetical protein [Pseudochrobactrum asaccharolyticum]MCF7672780.1 hypothetical protein [Bacillus subtilis]